MATDPMGPAVWSDPQVQFFLMGRAKSLGVLDRKFALEGFDFPLELADVFFFSASIPESLVVSRFKIILTCLWYMDK